MVKALAMLIRFDCYSLRVIGFVQKVLVSQADHSIPLSEKGKEQAAIAGIF